MIFFLAIRNLYLQRKRYFLMGLAIAIGFALITILTGLSYGALETVKTKAARYYSGHVTVYGLDEVWFNIYDPEPLINSIKLSNLPLRTVSSRSVYYGKETRLFFGGKYIRILRSVGIDFKNEINEMAALPFSEGSVEDMLGIDGQNGILISRISARLLGASLGDDIILNLVTTGGQHNTAVLVVKGIFEENGIFGYSAYINKSKMNQLIQKDENWSSEIAVYGREGVNSEKLAVKLRNIISEKHEVLPGINDRKDFSRKRASNSGNKNEVFAVISVDGQLDELKSILDAFLTGTYFILVIFLLIVMAGILNTYRVLVYERTREIGTMRAIGMQSRDVRSLFLYEASALAVISSLAGLLFGAASLFFLTRFIDIKDIPASDMFTTLGKLHFFIDFKTVLFNIIFMLAAVIAAAWGPAEKASSMPPAEALRKD